MRTVMKNKVFTRLMTALLLAVTVISAAYPSVAYAQVDEKEAAKETVKEEPKKPEITVIKKEEEKEVRYPNKLTAKEPENLKQKMVSNGETTNTNKGIPTEPTKSRASVTENVNNANQDYPIHHGEGTGEENDKYSADARQFITFKTKSGKTFHLIINHDEEGQNVMLLTEVSEDDLLNMVEIKEKPKEVKKMEEMPPQAEVKKEEPVKEAPKKEEKSGAGLYLFLGAIIITVAGVGYYFKIYKKNLEESEDDEDYDELEDDYENEEKYDTDNDIDEVIADKQEENEVDDMAIDAYEDEDE